MEVVQINVLALVEKGSVEGGQRLQLCCYFGVCDALGRLPHLSQGHGLRSANERLGPPSPTLRVCAVQTRFTCLLRVSYITSSVAPLRLKD